MSLYKNFKESLERTAETSGRSLDKIDLIAVSKKKSIEDIRQVIQAGHRSFGENLEYSAFNRIVLGSSPRRPINFSSNQTKKHFQRPFYLKR